MPAPTDPDQPPSDLSGYEEIGRLRLPRSLAQRLRRQAQARGLTVSSLAREWLADRIMAEPDPTP